MTDEKSDLSGLVGQLPLSQIYEDGFKPALTEVGKGLQGAVKIALTPITALVWCYEKIAVYLDDALPRYFSERKIDKSKIDTPDPSIAVPIVNAMQYSANKSEIREMFVNLLGASMNTETKELVHPSFVGIINQLTSDEGRILRLLYYRLEIPIITFVVNEEGKEKTLMRYFSDIIDSLSSKEPSIFERGIENLLRLNLVRIDEANLPKPSLYTNTKKHPALIERKLLHEGRYATRKLCLRLTSFGKYFCDVCLDTAPQER